ncbi:hypothetical protein OF83DRAFT_822162 [Amylostereum chailletii]|nr:hypothetical protein OF83DRAFT_822162 [Amylostereum chailletii]
MSSQNHHASSSQISILHRLPSSSQFPASQPASSGERPSAHPVRTHAPFPSQFSGSSRHGFASQATSPSLGQTASQFLQTSKAKKTPCSCAPLDRLLDGGISKGDILEISGPPGTAKEHLAVRFVRAAVRNEEEVLFVDMQNMVSADALSAALGSSTDALRRVHYHNIYTLSELLVFLRTLPSFLEKHPSVTLLVLNSLWFPFQQTSTYTRSERSTLLTKTKQDLSKLCATQRVAIITTSQLSTKLVHADGSPANFDTGAKAVLVPQLGTAYLPSSWSYRVIIVPESRRTGVLRLLTSPKYGDSSGIRQEQYEIVNGEMEDSSNQT